MRDASAADPDERCIELCAPPAATRCSQILELHTDVRPSAVASRAFAEFAKAGGSDLDVLRGLGDEARFNRTRNLVRRAFLRYAEGRDGAFNLCPLHAAAHKALHGICKRGVQSGAAADRDEPVF